MGKNNNNYSGADMAKLLRDHSTVLTRETDNTVAEQETKQKDEVREAAQTEALNTAKTNTRIRAGIVKPKRTREERARADLTTNLDIIAQAPHGSEVKVLAWSKLLDIMERYPKRTVFDQVLMFFVSHRKDEFLDQMYALQGMQCLQRTTNLKIRTIYEVMRNLASGTASPNNLSVEALRGLFGNEFPNWVDLKMTELNRATRR